MEFDLHSIVDIIEKEDFISMKTDRKMRVLVNYATTNFYGTRSWVIHAIAGLLAI